MTPAALVLRAADFGYRVELSDGGPRLVPTITGAMCPPGYLADLKAHRSGVVRYLLLSGLLARAKAAGRKVWALAAGDPCAWVVRGVGDDRADWIVLEGGSDWVPLPRGDS